VNKLNELNEGLDKLIKIIASKAVAVGDGSKHLYLQYENSQLDPGHFLLSEREDFYALLNLVNSGVGSTAAVNENNRSGWITGKLKTIERENVIPGNRLLDGTLDPFGPTACIRKIYEAIRFRATADARSAAVASICDWEVDKGLHRIMYSNVVPSLQSQQPQVSDNNLFADFLPNDHFAAESPSSG
jgi:hypothetical protein